MKISVLVKTNARNPSVEKIDDRNFRIAVHEPAKEGKANDAVIRALAKRFAVPKNCVRLVSGAKAKQKILEILF